MTEDNFYTQRIDNEKFFTYITDKHSYTPYSITIPNYDKIVNLVYNRTQDINITNKIMNHLKFQTFQEDYYTRIINRDLESDIHENELLLLIDDITQLLNTTKYINNFQADFFWRQAQGSYIVKNNYKVFSTSLETTAPHIENNINNDI